MLSGHLLHEAGSIQFQSAEPLWSLHPCHICAFRKFLQDACEAIDSAKLLEATNTEISLHVTTLVTYLRSYPRTRAVIVPPLPQLSPVWFNVYLPCFTTYLVSEVSKISQGQFQVLAPFVALSSSFESDRIHLNADAGDCFIQYVLNGVDQLLPVIDAMDVSSGLQSLSQVPVSAPTTFPHPMSSGSATASAVSIFSI